MEAEEDNLSLKSQHTLPAAATRLKRSAATGPEASMERDTRSPTCNTTSVRIAVRESTTATPCGRSRRALRLSKGCTQNASRPEDQSELTLGGLNPSGSKGYWAHADNPTSKRDDPARKTCRQ